MIVMIFLIAILLAGSCNVGSSCLNGATCTFFSLGPSFTCICATGYTGVNCQYGLIFRVIQKCIESPFFLNHTIKSKALPCVLSNPCLNGATCSYNNLGGYTCACVSGYTGTDFQYGKNNITNYLLFLKLFLFCNRKSTFFYYVTFNTPSIKNLLNN